MHNPHVSFDIVTFAIYSNNNGNMVVGEIPEFFQFPKRDISTARCKCTIYIFTYKGINVVIRIEFINMIVLLSMWAVFLLLFFFNLFFFLLEAEFNSFLKEIVLVMRNCWITLSEIELIFGELSFGAADLCIRGSYLKNYIWFKFSINIFWIKRMIHIGLWIRIYLLEFNFLFDGVKDVMNTRW